LKKLIEQLTEYLREGTLVSRSDAMVSGILGALANIFFYVVFKYGFHLPYENFWLRMVATLLCISLIFMHRLPESFSPYFPYFWHTFLIIILPFTFTVNLLMNNFHELWLYWEIFMVFVLMMFVPNWLLFMFDLLTGVLGAILFHNLSVPYVPLNPTFNIPLYSIVISFSIVAGSIFSFANRNTLKELERKKAEEKYRALEALAGSIAHEMRNPLSQVRQNLDEILLELPRSSTENDYASLPKKNIETIQKRAIQAQTAINRGLQVITVTLGNFRNTDVSKKELTCLSATTITRKAIEEYGYASEHERQKIYLSPGEDFIFLGEENNYILLFHNLLENALQILQQVPDGRLAITIQRGESVNRILIRDNGPGIPPNILPRIFEPFFTSGKKNGTGLGLAFCQRVMKSFNGQISCKSEVGIFTEFTLEFPVLDKATINKFERNLYAEYTPFLAGKNVLMAAIPEAYVPSIRQQLMPLKIGLDNAEDNNKALEMLAANHYDLVLSGISPLPAGTAKLGNIVKNKDRNIPVVGCSFSPLPPVDTINGVASVIIMPPALPELLNAMKSSLEMARETLKESLSGKTVLVADDLDFNRRVIKLMLNKLGITIFEASNGLEALNILKSQPCDLLVIDMRMPVLDGFETAQRIRAMPSPYRDIPILGLSGNLDNATLKLAKESGINDTLLKPVKLKPFLQKVTSMLKVNTPAA